MADLDADSPWGAPSASSMLAPSYADEGAALGGPEPSADDESEIDAGQLVRKEELVKSVIELDDVGWGWFGEADAWVVFGREILARQDGLRGKLTHHSAAD